MKKRTLACCAAVLLATVGFHGACDDTVTGTNCGVSCQDVDNTCVQKCTDDARKTPCATDFDHCKASCTSITVGPEGRRLTSTRATERGAGHWDKHDVLASAARAAGRSDIGCQSRRARAGAIALRACRSMFRSSIIGRDCGPSGQLLGCRARAVTLLGFASVDTPGVAADRAPFTHRIEDLLPVTGLGQASLIIKRSRAN